MGYRPIRKTATKAASRTPVKRGRRPNRSKREGILRAASRILEGRGYYGTTLREVAKEAGMTPSLLQKYFPTKKALLEGFVEDSMDRLDSAMNHLRHYIATVADPTELVRVVGERYVAFVSEMRGFYLTWIMCPELTEPYRDSLPAFVSIAHVALANALAERLGISHENALLRARMLFASLFAYVIYYRQLNFPGFRLETQGERLERLARVIASRRDVALPAAAGHG